MMDIKYTNDGKKVVVISNLNSQETIVQEIFVSEKGEEIPYGEKFTVKNLFDEPMVSWKEKHLKEIEERYEKTFHQKEKELADLVRKYSDKSSLISSIVKSFTSLEKNMKESDFETLVNCISGKITHVVIKNYNGYEIYEFQNKIGKYDRYDNNIKLISLYGNSNGYLNYHLHQYSDGSGGNKDEIYPFTSYELAFDFIKNNILSEIEISGVDKYIFDNCVKYNIEIPKEKLFEYYNKVIDSKQDMINKNRILLEDSLKEIEIVKNKLNNL